MPLDKYRQKRDFHKTPEPSGDHDSSDSDLPVFVIHKHAATRLHYDLRLEATGAMPSWAVTKGPSLNPKDNRLAIHVEDHPLDYRHFEGIIPKENYGAGEVIIWDEGVYSIEDTSEEKAVIEQQVRDGIEKGKMHLFFYGKKLKGGFALFRIEVKDGKEHWILKKRKDDFASDQDILQQDRSVRTGKTIEELNERPKNTSPMLGTLHDKPFDSDGWLFEIKWDGYRAIADVDYSSVKLISRNKKSFNELFPPIVSALQQLNLNAVLDGEVVAVDEDGVSQFQLLQMWNKEQQGALQYVVFDILWLNGIDLTKKPLIKRKKILADVLKDAPPSIIYSDHVVARGKEFFHLAARNKLEGVMAKRCSSTYQVGKRSKDWLKIKVTRRQEVVIGGWTEPRETRSDIGALILGVHEGDKLVYVGHTGTGMNSACRIDLLERLQKLERTSSPFKTEPKTNEKPHWVQPELVCEVKFTEWTRDGSMRHPVFIGLREDKDPKFVVREEEDSQEEVGKQDKIIKFAGKEVPLTNLQKEYFPAQHLTKGDVISYYERIAPVILPYLKNRPQVLLRHPNGIDGKSFYQKEMKDIGPDWFPTHKIYSKSNNDYIHYALIEDEASLLYMINLGCIELNPWSSQIGQLHKPDWLILDLDPDGNPFSEVVQVAQVIHSLLNELNIESYCKTSGKTGLHIYIPLGAQYSYEVSRQFAQLLAKLTHERISSITSIERPVQKRRGKIYIDYLQNRYGQTLAAPYSLRPWPGATVSTPLHWDEVTEDILPTNYNIETIFERIEKYDDLFKDLLFSKINIETVMKNIKNN